MLQLGIMRRTLTSFGCPCQQHYCLQPLAKKIRTANLTQQHFRELEPRKMGLTAVNPQEELWKNHTKHLHHTLTLCCACRASHITVHVLPSGSLKLQHSVGAEGPLRMPSMAFGSHLQIQVSLGSSLPSTAQPWAAVSSAALSVSMEMAARAAGFHQNPIKTQFCPKWIILLSFLSFFLFYYAVHRSGWTYFNELDLLSRISVEMSSRSCCFHVDEMFLTQRILTQCHLCHFQHPVALPCFWSLFSHQWDLSRRGNTPNHAQAKISTVLQDSFATA